MLRHWRPQHLITATPGHSAEPTRRLLHPVPSPAPLSPQPPLRYEDLVSNPGHTFAIGVMLSDISAHTVDEAGQRAFVTGNPLSMLRKVGRRVQLQQVAAL